MYNNFSINTYTRIKRKENILMGAGRPKTGEFEAMRLLLPKGWKKQLMLIGYKQSIDKDKIVPLQEVIRSALKEKYNLK